MKLSIIITAHNEGLLAHKTMRSVERALEQVEGSYEVIINLDRPDDETKKYFEKYNDRKNYVVTQSDCGDTGGARNHAIKQAEGKYVIFMDADDLVSKNYFSGILEVLESTREEVMVYPQYCLAFEDCGDNYTLQELQEASNTDYDIMKLFGRHRWISSVGGQRKTFLEHPYIRDKDGFGHEDYALIIELAGLGIEQRVAKNAVHFYRRRAGSQSGLHNSTNVTQPYSDLFAFERWHKMANLETTEKSEQHKTSPKDKLKNIYIKLRNRKVTNAIIAPVATVAKKLSGKKLIAEGAGLPSAVLEEWKEIGKIEMRLYPMQYRINSVVRYSAEEDNKVGEVYWKLCQQIDELPDYVFVVPWVVSGGADKVLLNYLKAIQDIHPKWKVAVITTLQSKNEWKDRLPKNTFLIDFGNNAARLSEYDRDVLFTRLLLQLKCRKVHIIHSAFAFDWMKRHQDLVKANFEIVASLFCYCILPGTKCEGLWSFADPHAARVYHLLRAIFTDNTVFVDTLVKDHGFDREKILVHHQPTNKIAIQEKAKTEGDKLKILWAGRISFQKNPELLVRIAKKLDANKVQIDAFGRIDRDELEGFKFPDDVPTLKYHGAFGGFDELDAGNYDLFLHTARQDGMPNIILEAASAGLPTIASNVGGISDFVRSGETGFLIDDYNNEDRYVEAISQVLDDSDLLKKMADGAKDLLESQYSWDRFVEAVKRDF